MRTVRSFVRNSRPLPNQRSAEIGLHGNWLGIDSGAPCLILTSQIVWDQMRLRRLGQQNRSPIALNHVVGISLPCSCVTAIPVGHHCWIAKDALSAAWTSQILSARRVSEVCRALTR